MTTPQTDVPAALRQWAKGMYTSEAAVELLLRAFNGRFAGRGYPWIKTDTHGTVWFDVDELTEDSIGAYSGGEKRLLLLAAALITERSIDLGDIASGMGRNNLQLALAALAHAGGSHQHSRFVAEGEDENGAPISGRFEQQTSLYPWPGE